MTDQTAVQLSAAAYARRISLMYGTIFALLGVQLPFLSVWLASEGVTAAGIGLALALPALLRLVANPAIAMFADARRAHARTIAALSVAACAAASLLGLVDSWITVLVAVTVLLLSLQTAMPLIEVIAMRGVRAHQLDYGRMRLWGSLTFIGGTVLGGSIIEHVGPGAFPTMIAITALACVAAAFALPPNPERARLASGGTPTTKPSSASEGWLARMNLAAVRTLLADRHLLVILFSASLVQASHAVYYAFSAVHWETLGFTGGWIGALWAWGVIAEIVLFAVSARVVALFGARGLLLIGALAGLVRWSAMAFEPTGAGLILLQALHALTFGATHLAAMYIISQRVSGEQAGLAQALFATFASGIIMAAALFAAGRLFDAAGPISYFAMTGLSAMAFGLTLLLT
ncbi:MAG: MFS transporter, partial [Pseudomonadota bacterium]